MEGIRSTPGLRGLLKRVETERNDREAVIRSEKEELNKGVPNKNGGENVN